MPLTASGLFTTTCSCSQCCSLCTGLAVQTASGHPTRPCLWPFYDSSQCRSLCTGLAVQTASGHPTCPWLPLAFLRQAVSVVACMLAWPCKQPVDIRHAPASFWPFYDNLLAVSVLACVLAWPCKQPVIIRHAPDCLWPFYDFNDQCRSLCTGLAMQTASGHLTCPCLWPFYDNLQSMS